MELSETNHQAKISDLLPSSCAEGEHGLWVFGYGSLMWRPGFQYDAQIPARCSGLHRSLCIWSLHHRGTLQNPGLVLGLDFGGVCHGTLFRVSTNEVCNTLKYLREREQRTRVYREIMRQVDLLDGSGRSVRALCYVADRSHRQFAFQLSLSRKAEIIKQAHGASGHNLDYLSSTVAHLEAMNIKDDNLRRILVLTNCAHRL